MVVGHPGRPGPAAELTADTTGGVPVPTLRLLTGGNSALAKIQSLLIVLEDSAQVIQIRRNLVISLG